MITGFKFAGGGQNAEYSVVFLNCQKSRIYRLFEHSPLFHRPHFFEALPYFCPICPIFCTKKGRLTKSRPQTKNGTII